MKPIQLQSHQLNDYNNICDVLKENKMCLYVTATGTGKSYVSGKYIQEHNLLAFIIVPSVAIKRQWEEIIDAKIVTYQKLLQYTTWELINIINEYDFFVIDEAHHSGSFMWGDCVDLIKKMSGEKRILGLTANPNRYSTTKYDVVRDMFENNVVTGFSLYKSIEKGILPQFDFISALYSNPYKDGIKIHKKLTDKETEELHDLVGRLDLGINNTKLKEIVFKHLPDDTRKIVIFVPDIKYVEDAYNFVHEVFVDQDYVVFDIHSKRGSKYNRQCIEEFERSISKISILITVNMLNEGRHIKGVNTIFMIRRTKSPQVYMQQIGRALSTDNKTSRVVIYDFVRNHENIDYGVFGNINSHDEYDDNDHVKISKSNQVIKYFYMEDMKDIISEIENMISTYFVWTEDRIKILKKHYPTMGGKVCELIPGSTKKICIHKASQLDIKYIGKFVWTEDRIKILKKHYPTIGVKVYELIPGSTKHGCSTKASQLGIKCTGKFRWTEENVNILREKYPSMGSGVYTLMPGSSKKGCATKAIQLGIKYIGKFRWTEENVNILREKYPSMGSGVYTLMPGSTKHGCITKASQLGIKYIKQ